jgi:hypothetical protein
MPGSTNTVTDAMSWRDAEAVGELMALSDPSFKLFDELRAEHKVDQAL